MLRQLPGLWPVMPTLQSGPVSGLSRLKIRSSSPLSSIFREGWHFSAYSLGTPTAVPLSSSHLGAPQVDRVQCLTSRKWLRIREAIPLAGEAGQRPRFSSILHQGSSTAPKLVGYCFCDPEHNKQLGTEGHGLRRSSSSNCSSIGISYGGKRGVSCVRSPWTTECHHEWSRDSRRPSRRWLKPLPWRSLAQIWHCTSFSLFCWRSLRLRSRRCDSAPRAAGLSDAGQQ